MRWGNVYATAIATGAFLLSPDQSTAFLAPRRRTTVTVTSSSGSFASSSFLVTTSSSLAVGSLGWDNEDYLEALSKGPEAINEANAQYQKYSRFSNMKPAGEDDDDDIPPQKEDDIGSVPGASGLSMDQLERIKRDNEESTSSGGARFQEMMARAQQTPPMRPPPTLPPPPVADTSKISPALPAGFENLSVEAQAALFRQLMTPNPAEAATPQWPPAPGPRPPATGQAATAADGRRIGRNRDADAIVNSSDVYFAQLKLDSTTRNQARYIGDAETADAVFANPAIQEIALHTNPYLEESRKQEQALLDTVAEEMLVFHNYEQASNALVSLDDRGVSYKEKLREKKKGAAVNLPEASRIPAPQSLATSTVAPVEPVKQDTPPAVSIPSPVDTMPPSQSLSPPPRAESMATTPTDESSRRQDVRTLMGMLLKHRGGPGFGAGRITGNEKARFETLAANVMAVLRSEPIAAAVPVQSVVPSTAAASPIMPMAETESVATMGREVVPQSPRVPAGDRINSMLSCIEGAVLMYRNAPLEMQAGLLVTLNNAVLSAINTCNEIVAGPELKQFEAYRTALSDPRAQPSRDSNGGPLVTSNIPIGNRIASSLLCMEGAVQMYRNSPPELQSSVMVTLRVALLSAANTLNEALCGPAVDPLFDGYGGTTASLPSPAALMQTFDVVPESSSPTSSAYAASGISNDDNAVFLESVYERLKAAAGDGKMGLRDDMDSIDAESLANDIIQMRKLLVDELNGDNSSSTSSPPSASAASKYQEMLAKARADKAAGH